MRKVSRDTFNVCADSAETMAVKAESGEGPADAATACRFLATMFRSSAERAWFVVPEDK
jgi:hypothetical protein